ncbi:MAG: protein phosphatase 2C domain-containing protein [Balneolaceae bacterium]|nr:protein phosphatase 2C domain-containing protein [Balneolaceae bacterium]MBO6545176.1 protein phosphatase 2C domain-containing protein [Balneolaceae bacterium]MBO6646572.1 protein phosphatase 2C domain-containing protein [Balneolaceae bacterium]
MSEKKFISYSKKGLNRNSNQDRILVLKEKAYRIFILFDGVSSNSFSYLFIEEFKKRFRKRMSQIRNRNFNVSDVLFKTHQDTLESEVKGLSTMSVLYFNDESNKAEYLNIGDSRIYIFTNKFLEKITTDDSLKNRSNIITKCLGMNELTQKDFESEEISENYNFLMCSDGFYNLMEENLKDYFITFNFKYMKNIDRKLKELQRRKNQDDSTYILIKNDV